MSDLESLLFYIFNFILSAFFLYIVEKKYKKINEKNSRIKIIIFSLLGIMIPILIAGLRYNVGTDFETYMKMFNAWKEYDITQIFTNMRTEVLFGMIIKISGIFNNYRILFFISSLITVLMVYLSILYNKEKISIALAFLLYLLLYFPSSLNVVRQAIAVAIVLYSYRYVIQKNILKFAIAIIIASMFHTTAILLLPFYFIFNFEKRENNLKNLLKIIYLFFLILIVLNYNSILKILTGYSAFQKYQNYGYIENFGGNKMIIVDTIILAIILLYRKPLEKYDKNTKLYIFMMIVGYILELTGFISPYIKRIAVYFNICSIYVLSMFPKIAKNKKEKNIIVFFIIIYAILLFFISIYLLKQGNIIPYNILVYE